MNAKRLNFNHLKTMIMQESQKYEQSMIASIDLEDIEGDAFFDDGALVACAGVRRAWDGRGLVWMLVSDKTNTCKWVKYVRFAYNWLEEVQEHSEYRRLETTASVNNRQDIRWLKLLGFEIEGLMKKYGPDGSDHIMYARVK